MDNLQEEQYLTQQTKLIDEWFKSPRFANVQRSYSARDVAVLRQSLPVSYASNLMSQKLWAMLRTAKLNKTFHHTFGALDPVQVTNLSKYLTTIYVSGWQCSSTASTTNEPGPDFADYPYDTVPNKTDQLFKALLFHDRVQNESRSRMDDATKKATRRIDYLTPIVADGDTGFGGTSSVMKLIKLFIEAGAAGVHIEDQRPGAKKCGHMAGKVLVSTREHCQRLIAARLQADIMGTELVLVARTDALGARLIDSNIDPVDHPYILGQVEKGNPKRLLTFVDAGKEAIAKTFSGDKRDQVLQEWNLASSHLGLHEAMHLAQTLGFTFYFDWESPRSADGFYQTSGSVEFCATRAKEYLKYADLLWMETPTAELPQAKRLAELVNQSHPNKMLAYNLSPSFNWSAGKMTDQQISTFCADLGQLGFVWQFITLAGFHMNALASEIFAKDFSERKMISYVEEIQRKESVHNVDQLTHQKWSGAELLDKQITMVANDNSLASTSKDSTEHQFEKKLTRQVQPAPKLLTPKL